MNRPNIVFVLTDDQGAWAMGCAGNSEVLTPNIDQLAAEGMRFDNFFCASPVCSPARASLLTGRIPSQHGVHDWLKRGNLEKIPGIPVFGDDDCTIEYLQGMPGYTDFLAQAGYTCAISGKWHMGDSLKPQKGFTGWYVFPYGGSNHYFNPVMIREGQVGLEAGYLTDLITAGALDFIRQYSQNNAPFYLSVNYTAPHSPWEKGQHPEALTGLYADCAFETCPEEPCHPWQINSAPRGTGERRRELLTGYYAAITGLDRGVGALVAELKAQGVFENTLFIFGGDNGMNMGHHGIWGKGNGTFPQNMYDTSVKVPFIMSWPGHIPAGTVSRHLLSHYDVMPTLLDYLDIPNPEAPHLPGRSFKALLHGETLSEREVVVVFDEYGPVRMIRTPQWKYVHRYPYGPHELYDLEHDPDERTNLSGNPAYQARQAELRNGLERWFLRYVNPDLDGARQGTTGKGQLTLAGVDNLGQRVYDHDYYQIDENGKKVI